MLISLLLIAAGFVLLVVGGEVIVRSAVYMAERLGVSAFVVGAVIIGFGSSTPELVTSIEASLLGSPGIALGNIVGSNIINVLVVLGIAAVICPIVQSGLWEAAGQLSERATATNFHAALCRDRSSR